MFEIILKDKETIPATGNRSTNPEDKPDIEGEYLLTRSLKSHLVITREETDYKSFKPGEYQNHIKMYIFNIRYLIVQNALRLFYTVCSDLNDIP